MVKLYAPKSSPKTKWKSTLRTSLVRYRRNWFWFVLSVSLMLAIPMIYQYNQIPVYKSSASLVIKNTQFTIPSTTNAPPQLHSIRSFEEEIGTLKSYTLMHRVVHNLGLHVRYYAKENLRNELFAESPVHLSIEKSTPELYNNLLELRLIDQRKVVLNGTTYPINQSIRTPYGQLRVFPQASVQNGTAPILIKVSMPSQAVTSYLTRLTVEIPEKQSGIVAISLVDALPERGEAILNQLIHEYSREASLQKQKEAHHLLDSIEDRLVLIADELTTAEKGVDVPAAQTDSELPEGKIQPFLTEIQKNDAQLSEVDQKLAGLETLEQFLRVQMETKQVEQATFLFSEPQLVHWVNQLLKHEENARKKMNKAAVQLLPAAQLKSIKANITSTVRTLRKQLVNTRDQLRANNRRSQNMARRILRKGKTLLTILGQQDVKVGLYRYLLQKREETALAALSAVWDSRVIDVAWTDRIPVEPFHKLVFLIFGLAGLFLPIAYIGIKDALNDRVRQHTDVEGLTEVPILGEIAFSRHIEADNLVFKPHLQSVISEQIRALRTNLQFLQNPAAHHQVILITSCLSGEGKSLISINLGASLALVNRPTIILEMDMRKPRLHKSLHMQNRVGISSYLIGKATIDDIIQPIQGYENYFIATAGPLPPNPSELLSSPRLGQLFYELKERFDFIIIDSPPIGLVTDAQLMASLADTTLFVVRQNFTPKNCLRLINSLHNTQWFQNLNIIMNAVGEGEMIFNDDYGSDYTDDLVKTGP